MIHLGDNYTSTVPFDVVIETAAGTYMASFDRSKLQKVSPALGYSCNFEAGKPSESKYAFKSANFSNSKGTATYKDVTYTYCLKMESNTQVTFSTDKTLTFVLLLNANGTVKVDSVKHTANGDGVVSFTLEAGDHIISKDTSSFLFYLEAMHGTALPTDVEEQPIWAIRFVKTETDEEGNTTKMTNLYPDGCKESQFVLTECETYNYQFAL